jgi:hypothetical protein
MLSKRVMEVWMEVDEDEVGASAVRSRSEMNSLKAGGRIEVSLLFFDGF